MSESDVRATADSLARANVAVSLGDRRLSPFRRLFLFIFPMLVIPACLGTTGPDCTAAIMNGLLVRVRDSVTNIPAGSGATVTAEDGSYFETLLYLGSHTPLDSLTFQGATERPGTYTVRVSKGGYQPWTRTGINVPAGECHVTSVEVAARLQPLIP